MVAPSLDMIEKYNENSTAPSLEKKHKPIFSKELFNLTAIYDLENVIKTKSKFRRSPPDSATIPYDNMQDKHGKVTASMI